MSDSPVAPDGAPTPSPSLAGRGEIENPEGEKENEVSSFEELAADPEIAALLDFKPVPRKSSPPGAWTPEAQRQFIAWLAVIGSQGKACGRIGKDRGGATKLYNSPHGASFRAAWHGAIELFERRQSERIGDGPPPAAKPPTIDGRRKYPAALPHGGDGNGDGDRAGGEPQISEEEHLRIAEFLVGAFMKKVGAERRARLAGEIVAADFYLRQITFLEVMFDLGVNAFGKDAQKLLRELRRGGRHVIDIVATPFTDMLDASRREWWLQEGDPERPPHPDPRFVERHDSGPWGSRGPEGFSTDLQQHATGAGTPPARGYSPDEWAKMTHEEQRAARNRQFAEDAEEQREWERRAYAEYEQRRDPLFAEGSGEGEGER